MATSSYGHFLSALIDRELVTPDCVQACRRRVRRIACDLPPTAAMWADMLVRAGRLTAFQAQLALEGRLDELLVGDYVVTDEVGHGGMGTVLKAHPRAHTDTVAVKMIRHDVAGALPAMPGFSESASDTRQLDHPNIVHVYDVHLPAGAQPLGGPEGAAPQAHGPARSYVVCEFVKGTDVKHLMSTDGRVPALLAMEWIRPLVEGLVYAHDQGLVHGNIKPANILVTRDGEPKLSDFGIVRLGDPDDVDQLQRLVGTLDYIAPERTMDLSRVDPRSDQYSLGCTLYHMVTGRPPFPARGAVTKLLAHQTRTPTHPQQLCPWLPDEMAQLIQRLMQKDPSARFQAPGEFLDAVRQPIHSQRYVHGASSGPQAIPRWRRARRPRFQLRSLVGPLVCAAIIGAIIFVAWPRRRGASEHKHDPLRPPAQKPVPLGAPGPSS